MVGSAAGEERWSFRSSGRSRCAARGAAGAGRREAAGPARDPVGPRERARLQRSADRGAVAEAPGDGRQHPSGLRAKLRKALEPERTRGSSRRASGDPGSRVHASGRARRARRRPLRAPVGEGEPHARQRDHATAAERLRQALEFWRGPALADFAYDPFAQAEIARLEELRLDAVEERIEADLALGRAADLVGELEALISDNPLRERLRGQLMLALYRSGRQADALEAYRRPARPSTRSSASPRARRFSALQAAILRQEPALEVSIERAGRRPSRRRRASRRSALEVRKTVTVLIARRPSVRGLDPEALEPRGRALPRRPRADRGALRRNDREQPRQRGDGRVRGPTGPRGRRVPGRAAALEIRDARRGTRAARARRPASGSRPARSWRAVPAPACSSVIGDPRDRGGRARGRRGRPGEILVGEETERLVRGRARVEPVETEAGPAWRLRELAPNGRPSAR